MEQSVKKNDNYVKERNDLVAFLERNFGYVLQGRTRYNDFYESSISNIVSQHIYEVIPYNILFSLSPDDRIPAIQEGIRRTKAAFLDPESKEYAIFNFFREKEGKFLGNSNYQQFFNWGFGDRLSEGLRLGALSALSGSSWNDVHRYELEGNHFDNEFFFSKHPDCRSLELRGTWSRAMAMLDAFHVENNRKTLRNLFGLKPNPPREQAKLLCEIASMKVDNMRRLGDIEKEIGGSISVEAHDGKKVEIALDDSRYFMYVLDKTDMDLMNAISSVRFADSVELHRSLSDARNRLPRFGDVVASWTQVDALKKPLRPVSDSLLTAYMENTARPYEREYVELAAQEQPEIAETISIVRQVVRDEAMQASVNDGKHRMEFEDGEGSMKVVEISYDPDNDLYLVVGEGTGGRIQMKYDPRDDTVNSRSVGISESLLGRMMPVLEECVRTVENTVRKEKDEELQKAQDKTFNPKV